MAPAFRPSDRVRVVGLRAPPADHLALSRVQRPPRIGDTGTVTEVLPAAGGGGGAPRYLVESATGEAETIWLAEFAEDELALEAEFERRKEGTE